jgi:hypothetical protein
VLALVRSEIVSVEAFGGAVFTPAEDMASAIIKFQNGAVAHLTANRVALKPMRKMRVFSKQGYASLDFQTSQGMLVKKAPGWDFEKLDVERLDRAQMGDLWKFVFDGLLQEDVRVRIVVSVPNYVHAEVEPVVIGPLDDLEFLFSQQEPRIDVRASTRGRSLGNGGNRSRLEALRRRFESP